jgi:hypothetical protein
MSRQADTKKCQWDGSDGNGLCDRPATLHIDWKWESGYQRHAHFCDKHSAILREHKPGAQIAATVRCGAGCQVILAAL